MTSPITSPANVSLTPIGSRDLVDGLANTEFQHFARRGQFDPAAAALAFEQLRAEPGFQQRDLAMDRRRRDVQIFAGLAK
jgi:hypothetical protein